MMRSSDRLAVGHAFMDRGGAFAPAPFLSRTGAGCTGPRPDSRKAACARASADASRERGEQSLPGALRLTSGPRVRGIISAERRAPSAERRAPSAERRAPSAERRAPSAERRAPSAERRAPSAERRAPSAERRAPSAERRAPSAERRAPSAERPPLDDTLNSGTGTPGCPGVPVSRAAPPQSRGLPLLRILLQLGALPGTRVPSRLASFPPRLAGPSTIHDPTYADCRGMGVPSLGRTTSAHGPPARRPLAPPAVSTGIAVLHPTSYMNNCRIQV